MGGGGDSRQQGDQQETPIPWKDFGIELNSWEPWDYVHAQDLIAKFYQNHPGAARYIRSIEFQSIPLQSTEVPRHHFLKGIGGCKGTSALKSGPVQFFCLFWQDRRPDRT